MTKGEAIDQIYIAINGGKPTSESKVQKGEIENYLSATIDYVQYEVAKERLMLDLKTKKNRIFSSLSSKLDGSLYRTVRLKTHEDKMRDELYVDLPDNFSRLPDNSGFRYMSPLKGNKKFVKSTRFAFDSIEHLMGDNTYFYFENVEGKDRVYIQNFDYPLCDVELSISISVSDLEDHDKIPVSAGYEKIVIDLCVEFFKFQKGIPEDNKIDGVDAV